MARYFKETAHLKTDKKKFDEGYERIFGRKGPKKEEIEPADDMSKFPNQNIPRKPEKFEKRIFDNIQLKILPYDPHQALETHQVVQVRNPKDGNWYDLTEGAKYDWMDE